METKYIAGMKVNNLDKKELLKYIDKLIRKKKHSYIVTPYSEFLLRSLTDHEFKDLINKADLSLADGMGILIGEKYLSMRGNKYIDLLKCLFAPLVNRRILLKGIKEKLSGSEVIYDICELAEKKQYKIFLLGGFDYGNGPSHQIAKNKLTKIYHKIQIVGTYGGSPAIEEENKIVEMINRTGAQILFVAYGTVPEEKWIYRNYRKLKPMVSIGVGTTIDYVAGERKKVPKHLSDRGLEGLLKPFVSERGDIKQMIKRLRRAWGTIIKYILVLIKERSKIEKQSKALV